MLKVENLIVFFENAIAVNEISIEVKEGEIVGLFGPNSAGKTTIINVISGLILDIKKKEERRGGERITIKGRIYFDGKDITWLWPDKRAKMGIATSRERHPVFPEISVEENLKIAAYLLNRNLFHKRLEVIYSIFPHLRLIRKRKAGLLSGGEQQMLSISMALMPSPRLILLDEPLFGLSPALYNELLSAINRIREKGTAVLISDQFIMPILPIIDRGYVIENGSLVFHGTRKDLMNSADIYLT